MRNLDATNTHSLTRGAAGVFFHWLLPLLGAKGAVCWYLLLRPLLRPLLRLLLRQLCFHRSPERRNSINVADRRVNVD